MEVYNILLPKNIMTSFCLFLKAFDIQVRVLNRIPLEQPELIPSQKRCASLICVQFAEHYLSEKDYVQAVKNYKEALFYTPTDSKVNSFLNPSQSIQQYLCVCLS